MTNKQPPESYIKRDEDTQAITVRIPIELKYLVDQVVYLYSTSQNRFVEAALRWYIEELSLEKQKELLDQATQK